MAIKILMEKEKGYKISFVKRGVGKYVVAEGMDYQKVLEEFESELVKDVRNRKGKKTASYWGEFDFEINEEELRMFHSTIQEAKFRLAQF